MQSCGEGEAMEKFGTGILSVLFVGWAAAALAVPAHRSLNYADGEAGLVIFKGKTHQQKCSACHRNGIFAIMRQGAEVITMQKIEQGDQCGACHDGRKAFGSSGNCNRCHRPAENH